MKLSTFPYLVQKEILENIKTSDLFLLSFVSKVLNARGVKHIDATKKPPTHTLPEVFKSPYSLNTDPISSHSYVVRKTDNRVASVSIDEDTFCFGVWNVTEEEFLTMVI